ncbi:MAG: nucleotidyltransferase family protein [Myxococcales bacterium]|nr:nucleotidyltransferase family protein [Myxococcales bacterium]
MSSLSVPRADEVLSVLRTVAAKLQLGALTSQPREPASWTLSPAALRLVREHMLGPLAARAGLAQCRRDAIANALLWDVRRELWREVVAAFAKRGIAAAPIKGMAYALDLYDDPGLRPMSDIDVLVPADAFNAACEVLGASGFAHTGGVHQRASSHHAMTFKRRGGAASVGVAIDLHRHIAHADRTGLNAEAWWARAIDRGVDGWQLAPLDALLLHIAHMARHEFYVPLVNVVDGALLMRHWQAQTVAAGALEPTWDDLRDAAANARMARMFSVWRYITQATLGLPTQIDARPRSLLTRLCTPDLNRMAVALAPTRPLQVGQKIALCQGPREVVALALSVARSAGLAWRVRLH